MILTCVATLLSLIWFYVYFSMFYKDDINPRNQRLAAEAMAPELEATTSVIQSDLVLVFAHPGDKTVEKTLEKPISSASIKNMLVVNEASGGVLRRTEALLQNLNEFESKEASLSVMWYATSMLSSPIPLHPPEYVVPVEESTRLISPTQP